MARKFLDRMSLLYGEPDTDDAPAFMAEYARMLRGYSDAMLDDALDRLLRTRKFKTWPTIAECLVAAESAAAAKAEKERPKVTQHDDFSARAEAMLRTEFGKWAAQEGIILSVYDHVQRTGKRPTEDELRAMYEPARYVDRCATGAVDMGTAHAALLKLARNMIIRREGLARRALGLPALTDAEKAEARA